MDTEKEDPQEVEDLQRAKEETAPVYRRKLVAAEPGKEDKIVSTT